MSYFTAQLGEAVRIAEAHLIAARFTRENERMAQMTRLAEKMKAAAAVGPRQAAKLEARADRIIAMEDVIERKADDSFGPHEQLLAEAESGLADVLHALAGATNGAPLDHSTDSPAAPEVGQTASTFPDKL